ncbi:MAG TPA: hypothetical protein VG328_01495 [Stellaceae bacterium]|jgi:ElaB/YqjD/DUF883 family membrane-anchored ribosome-binding protein|nr:hypothetical protein [Stellaceae bacterium]
MMSASNGHAQRDVAIETIKQDLAELQGALNGVRRQSANALQQQIHAQPFQSMAIAFAVGFVVSRIVAHKLL